LLINRLISFKKQPNLLLNVKIIWQAILTKELHVKML